MRNGPQNLYPKKALSSGSPFFLFPDMEELLDIAKKAVVFVPVDQAAQQPQAEWRACVSGYFQLFSSLRKCSLGRPFQKASSIFLDSKSLS